MKRLLVIFLICSLNGLIAQDYINNTAFGFGEKLEYKVGILTGPLAGLGGEGGISINKDAAVINGKQCYDVLFWVDSKGVVDLTYPVHDKYKSIIDISTLLPYEFHQRIREGDFKRDFKATFDRTNNIAVVGTDKYKIEANAHDILSALFYIRAYDIGTKKNGEIISLRNFYKDKTFPLDVRIVRRETVTVSAGKFRTIVVEPIVKEGAPFKFKNTIYVWLTDDERKVPVKVSTSIGIGEVGAELLRYSGVRGKIDAKLK